MILKIILLTVAIGAVLKILSDRFERLKPRSWWVGLVGAMATAIVCVVAFWQTEVEPLTLDDSQEISDNLRADIFARLDSTEQRSARSTDSLKALIKMNAAQEQPDSLLQVLAHEQSVLLEGIVTTELDKGLVAIGYERYDEALPLLDIALRAAHNNLLKRGEVFFYMGVVYENQSEDTLALYCYDSSVTYCPQSYGAWTNRGNTQSRLGFHEEAIASYDSALIYRPNYFEAWNNRGNALCDLGQYEDAITSYDTALVHRPGLSPVWTNRGLALGKLGLPVREIASYDSAVAYDHDYYDAWYNRGVALIDLQRFVEAVASFDKGLVSASQNDSSWFNRGIALYRLGHYEKAITSFDRAVTLCPTKYEAWFARGLALGDLGRREEEIDSYDNALAHKHDHVRAWNNRSVALAILERYGEALVSCDSALRYVPLGDSAIIALRREIIEAINE